MAGVAPPSWEEIAAAEAKEKREGKAMNRPPGSLVMWIIPRSAKWRERELSMKDEGKRY